MFKDIFLAISDEDFQALQVTIDLDEAIVTKEKGKNESVDKGLNP
jgi:hypothetical protein